MKKLISVMMALCLLCTAAAALAETLTMNQMPQLVTLEDVELTDADFEGEWIVDKVFYGETYLTPEQAQENNLVLRPMRIADGKVYATVTDEEGEHETSVDYTLENNQVLFTDEGGIEATFDKLEDGNVLLSIFLPGEDDTKICVSFFMVHPEE